MSSAAFFVLAPGTVVGPIPWLITRWEPHQPWPQWVAAQAVGVVLIFLGLVPLVSAFIEFVKAGGTPMPIAPTQRLVVPGFNRYLRNPMYFGLLLVILGQALLFASRYGAEYEAYRQAVPAWWPRLRAWTPTRHDAPETR